MSNYILAIGIDDYMNCTKLNNAVKDINNIIDILITEYDFEKSKVVKLLNEQATNENIINQLEIFNSEQEAGDNLLILFSGHGDYDDNLQMGYLIPVNSTPYSKSTYIPYSTIFNYIKALKSHHILLISDSCYSGSVFIPSRKAHTSKEKLDKIPSKWAITSGRIETVSDGEPGKNSPFADSLINILKNNKESILSVSEISNKIVSEVADKVEQIPRGEPLQLYGHKGGEFIFRKKSNKSSKKENKIEKEDSTYTKELIKSFYSLENKIEEAENNNNLGTVRRLNEEKNSLTNILNSELLKFLEAEKTNHSDKASIELPKEYLEKYNELLILKKKKNHAVEKQEYELAAKTRDSEKQLEDEINKILNSDELINKMNFSSNSLTNDYSIFQILADINTTITIDDKKEIEKLFESLLFLNLSYSMEYIPSFVYKDKTDNLVEKIKQIIKYGSKKKSTHQSLSARQEAVHYLAMGRRKKRR